MTTWEDVVCKAKELAATAGRKAVDMTDLAKAKLKIAENERALTATMEALGRLLYDERKGTTALPEDTVAELVAQADELKKQNEDLQAEIDNNRGKKTCPFCGASNEESALFCNQCGKGL